MLWLFILISAAKGQLTSTDYYPNLVARVERSNNLFSDLWIPLTLASAGVALEYFGSGNKWWQNKYDIQAKTLQAIPGYNSQVDDYLQFAPIVFVFGMNAANRSSSGLYKQQAKRLAVAELICLSTVNGLKWKCGQLRPDGSAANSFPSGHTAQAFLAARFLDKEYGTSNAWVRWLGYSMATTTGMCRILKNRHWLSDVMLGAGIGFLSVDLSYWLCKRRLNKNLVILPVKNNDTYGLAMSLKF